MEWKVHGDVECEPAGTSLYTAIFTTSYARLHLYDALAATGTQALYTDTDSLFYISHPERPIIPVGNYLGGWEMETDADDPIVSFVCTGCKSYSYRTQSGKCVTHVKGFTLNVGNSELINFDSMRDIACANRETVIQTVNPRKIIRDKYNYKIYNMEEIKRFSYQNDKRVFTQDFKSIPYGY